MRKIFTPMKYIITICSLICLLASCKSTNEGERLSVNAELLLSNEYFGCPFDTCSHKDIGVLQIIISNNTGNSTSFWIMKCTWHDSFIFEQDDINFCRSDCPGNFPIEMVLKPKESISFYSLIQQKQSLDESQTLRVGFIDFTEDELKGLLRLSKDYQKTKDIFWSNPVARNVEIGIKLNK